MTLSRFIAYTAAGALIWCVILTEIGYVLGQREGVLQNDEVRRDVTRILAVLVPLMALTLAVYIVRHRRRVRAEAS